MTDFPDPHWQDGGCSHCHTAQPVPGKPALRHNGSDALCTDCHIAVLDHVSSVAPEKDMLRRMPDTYKQALRKGKLACTTCHDLPAQCLTRRRSEQATNPMFLRGAPFNHRTDSCYLCHDAESYQRLNPHDQITDTGKVRKATCQFCHTDSINPNTAGSVEYVDFVIDNDLTKLCTGCHPWKPHPGGNFMIGEKFMDNNGPEHLAVPSRKMRQHMQLMATRKGIVLPLDPTNGKVFCGTCHNVHEKGLFKNAAAAKGADEKHRLRMQKMCTNCHEK